MRRIASKSLSPVELNVAQLWAPVAAILLGAFLIIGSGFAQPNLLHNAAHDARHSLAFPCH